jgi:hypothetical protein
MKNPGFTIIAVISIAIGVGANAAMFSFADGLVFRPLPVPRASEVVSVIGQARETGFGNRRLSYPDYVDLRDRSRSFNNPVAYAIVITSFQLLRGAGGASPPRSCLTPRRRRGGRTQSGRGARSRRVEAAVQR